LGRPRIYATNADRQKAYRDRCRVTKLAGEIVTISDRVQAYAEIIRYCRDAGVSVAFMAKKMRVRHCVIRAVLAATPSLPRAAPDPARDRRIRELVEKYVALTEAA